MARVGRKYPLLAELGNGMDDASFAGRVLRLFASSSWSDPAFLEELWQSGLVGTICRVLPELKAKAASRATSNSIQDLADLEEAIRKLRHELGIADKRLPNSGSGSSGGSLYPSWACVGHVCTLMLQALTHSAAAVAAIAVADQAGAAEPSRASSPPSNAAAARGASAPAPEPAGPTETPTPAGPRAQEAAEQPEQAAGAAEANNAADGNSTAGNGARGERPEDGARPSPAPAAAAAAAAGAGPSGSSTPTRGAAAAGKPGGSATTSPGLAGAVPFMATETGLVRLLSNKHVVPRAKEVLKAVPEDYQAALAKVLLTQISSELKATLAGVTHILNILKGDTAATSPAPSTLPKAWLATATLLSAYSDSLKANPSLKLGSGSLSSSSGGPAPGLGALAAAAAVEALSTGARPLAAEASANGAAPSSAVQADTAQGSATADGSSDVEMADAQRPSTSAHASGSGACAAAAGTASADAAAPGAADAAEEGDADPRVELARLLEEVAGALREAVNSAHGVSRMALLLRGEAAAKFNSAAAFMPTALSINELMSHLDALACVGAALGPAVTDRLRPGIASLLQSGAVKDLLGAGKVYVTTVISAGALTRDLEIDAVIPQSLRNGYMAAVLMPLETGALLNERRAPQVLAYRNSITESSYYQVMDAGALPYGVNVRFEDEQEAEGMGVVREWLSQIAADIFAPERGLFVRGAADKRVVHPSPLSVAQEDYMGYMRFAGRIVGLALRANVPLGVVLSAGLFKYLTGRRARLQDLEQIDPQVYTTCQNILANPGAEALDLYHVWHTRGSSGKPSASSDSGGGAASAEGRAAAGDTAAGSAGAGEAGASGAKDRPAGQGSGAVGANSDVEVEVELLPGGSKLRVTDDNKAVYVELLANHLLIGAAEEQCAAFLLGLQDTAAHLPEEARLRRAFLAPLQLEDLNRITAGESCLDPDEWAAHTDVVGFDSEQEQECLDMFWTLVAEYSTEDRQRLLQFWTAMTHLPSGGFKALNQRFQIMKLGPPAARQADAAAAAAAGDAADAADDGDAGAAAGAGEQQAAAAAPAPAPAADARGPSTGGAGPHSHQIDGDGLDGEEQEQDSGAEHDGGNEPAGARAAAAEAGAPRQAREGSPRPDGGNAAAPAPAAPAGDAAGGRAPSTAPSADGGDGGELPFAEDEYEEGPGDGEDDGMGYGDEEGEDEEFQRQLAMALALSLQDMPPPQEQQEQQQQGGDDAPAGGAGDGAGPSGAHARGSGAGGAGAGAGPPNGDADAGGDAPGPSGAAPAGAGGGSGAAAAAAAEGSEMRGDSPRELAQPDSAAGGAVADGIPHAREADGPDGAAAVAAPADGAVAGPASGDVGAATAAASDADGDAEIHLEPPAAAAAREDAGDAAAAAAAAEPATGEAEAAAGEESNRNAGEPSGVAAAAGNGAAAPTAHDSMDIDNTAAPAAQRHAAEDAAGAPQGGAEQPQAAQEQAPPPQPQHEEQEPGHGAGPQQPQEAEAEAGPAPPQPDAQSDVPQPEQAQLERQEQDVHQRDGRMGEADDGAGAGAAAEAGDAPMDAEGAGAAQAAAVAEAAPRGRAATMLPQARTCFLQLNLPLYESIEEMRRAFNIALDNMSFGLH